MINSHTFLTTREKLRHPEVARLYLRGAISRGELQVDPMVQVQVDTDADSAVKLAVSAYETMILQLSRPVGKGPQ